MTVRLLTNIGRLWTGSEVLSNAAIVTGDDRIAWVGPAAELRPTRLTINVPVLHPASEPDRGRSDRRWW